MKETKGIDGRVKLLYIILSILFAVGAWAYVSYTDNNMETNFPFNGVKVNFLNEDQLKDNGYIITNISADKINLRCNGRHNTLTRMDVGSVYATVDLMDIVRYSGGGINQLSIDVAFDSSIPSGSVNVASKTPSYIEVSVARIEDRSVPVRAYFSGGAALDYVASPPIAAMSTITVRGSREKLDEIEYASVTLTRENLSRSVTEPVPVRLVGKDGVELSMDGLELTPDTVDVTVTVNKVANVALKLNVVYGNSATELNTRVTIEPNTIKVSGDPEIIQDYNTIVLGPVDLQSFGLTNELTLPVPVRNDVNNLSGVTSAKVKIEIIGVETTRFSTSNISLRNAEGFPYTTIVTQSLDVTVRGTGADIDAINKNQSHENVRVVADLGGLDPSARGTFVVPAKVHVDGYAKVDAVYDYQVTVTISDTQPVEESGGSPVIG